MIVPREQLVNLLTVLGTDSARDWDVQTLENNVNENGILFYSPSRNPDIDPDLKQLLGNICDEQMNGKQITVTDGPPAVDPPDAEPPVETPPTPTEAPEPLEPGYPSIPGPHPPVAEPEPKPETDSNLNHDLDVIARIGPSDATAQHDVPIKQPPRRRQPQKKPTAKKAAPKKTKAVKKAPKKVPAKKPKKKTPKAKSKNWEQKLRRWKNNPVVMKDRPGIAQQVVLELEKAGKRNSTITKDELIKAVKAKFTEHTLKSLRYTISNLLGSRLKQQYGIDVQKTPTYDENRRRGYWIGKARQKA